jgi:hypothetical protein
VWQTRTNITSIKISEKFFPVVIKKEMSFYGSEAQSEFFLKRLQVYVPAEKLMEWYLLLSAWVCAIVFTIIALVKLSKIWTTGASLTFDDTNGKATKDFCTFSGLALVSILLVQFLTLRVTLACDACA